MLSLLCVLVCEVLAQPTVSAKRAMALIILNETRFIGWFFLGLLVLEMIPAGDAVRAPATG
jgi:hypothetical protein